MDPDNDILFWINQCLNKENASMTVCQTILDEFLNVPPEPSSCGSKKSEESACENSALHKILLGYCYPIVLTVCIVGNCANILTYRGKCLRKSTTVKMLTAKAVMNTVFMLCLLPHFFLLTFDGIGTASSFEYYLWGSWPYMLYAANVAGTCATW